MSQAATRNRVGYDEDITAWAEEQARLSRDGDFAALDLEHLAEEIEGVGASERREPRSRLIVLLRHLPKWHLPKWQLQTGFRSNSWTATIRTQRIEVEQVLKQNPSVRRALPELLPQAFQSGRGAAIGENGIERMPNSCPWTVEQVMSPEFLPD